MRETNFKQIGKSYADYLAERKPINKDLVAPKEMHAKRTRGFNAGYEFKQETIKIKSQRIKLFKINDDGNTFMKMKKVSEL
jgi:hypothetical protein